MDRNLAGGHFIDLGQKSLSARRAWIEIISVRGHGFWPRWSLSARRAWIEIVDVVSVQHGCESLSARRAWIEIGTITAGAGTTTCRSPQGERG